MLWFTPSAFFSQIIDIEVKKGVYHYRESVELRRKGCYGMFFSFSVELSVAINLFDIYTSIYIFLGIPVKIEFRVKCS